MRYLLLLLAILLVSAPVALAQDKDYGDWEFYIGYAHERANNGADRLDAKGVRNLPNGTSTRVDFASERRVPYRGVQGEVVANVHRNVGLVTNFSGTWANVEFFDRLSGTAYNARLHRYTLLFGPRFNFRNPTPLIPFAHALFGVTRYKAAFKTSNFSCPDTSETAFAMGLGAGLDIRAGRRIDIRPIQVDYLPVFFDHGREDGLRFSAGIKIKTN
jgi:hypothetical protein